MHSLSHCLMHLFHVTRYLNEVAGDVPACDVQASRQVGQTETFVHWTNVRHAVTRIHHHTREKAWDRQNVQLIYNSIKPGVFMSQV